MKHSIKRDRPKAWFGAAAAIASAVASLASAGVSAYQNKKNRQQQQAIEDYNNALASADSLNQNINDSYEIQKRLDINSNMIAKKGKRKSLKRSGYSSTGENQMIPVGNNIVAENKGNWIQTQPGFYLNIGGPTHEQGGIDVDVASRGKRKALLEMETNEGIYQNGNDATVITNRLINPRTGRTYLEDVLAGRNAEQVGNEQEYDRNHHRMLSRIGNRLARCGARKKALWGWNEQIGNSGVQGGDVYGAGISSLTNLAGAIINASSYAKMHKPKSPILVNRGKLNTTYNIDPQLAQIAHSANKSIDYIDKNVSSSATANELRTNVFENAVINSNNLRGTQVNEVNKMINDNIKYQDEGRQLHANILNDYRNRLTDWKNQRRVGIAGSWTGFLNSEGTALNNFATNVETRQQNKLNRFASSLSASPESLAYGASRDPETFDSIFGKGAANKAIMEQQGKVRMNNYYANPSHYQSMSEDALRQAGYTESEIAIIKGTSRLGRRKSLKRI